MTDITTYSGPTNLFTTPDLSSEQTPGRDVLLNPYHSPSVAKELMTVAQALVHPRGKGIYATDESPDVIEATLNAALGAESKNGAWEDSEEKKQKRKQWREWAYTAVPSEFVSGVILYSETLLEFKLAPLLTTKGIIPGVRANGELSPIPRSPSEFQVQGLDDLLPKLQAARAAGARFSKWRVQIACASRGVGLPSKLSLGIQAETLAQYAIISQQAGLVPIVEPDVEFSADADLARSAEVHEQAISLIYERLRAHGVLLEGTLIKPSYPQPGLKHPSRGNTTPEDIALATATVISRSVPISVPGVVFLSGGLPSITATKYLSAVNTLVNSSPPQSIFSRLPTLSFSYGRALQGDTMKQWVKGDENSAKAALEKWSKICWKAAKGEDVEE